MAGSWLMASVCMLRMKHISSTLLARFGNNSLTKLEMTVYELSALPE